MDQPGSDRSHADPVQLEAVDVVALRRASASDAPAIADLHVRAWRAAYSGLLPDKLLNELSVEARERSWSQLLSEADGSSFTLVAFDEDGRLKGFCAAATPSRDEDASEATAEIAATYVDAESWRAGIGSGLLDAALAELCRQGYEQATLWVFAENERARSFYREFGFEPDGREARHDWSGRKVEVRLRARITA
jgi:ribosomal protein S18 acetylase RimI-like enzyme